METQTAFDLNTAIGRWRDSLVQSPQLRPEDLDELEAHLRDSMAALRAAGLSEEEGFLIATRRLGAASALAPEFAKVNGREVWITRVLWMLTGLLLWGPVTAFTGAAADSGVIAGLLGFGYAPSMSRALLPSILFGVVRLASLGLGVIGCIFLFNRAGASFTKAIAFLVQRPSRLILAVLSVSFVITAGSAVSWVEAVLLTRQLGPDSYGALVYSRSLGAFATGPLVTVALVTAMFLLARRRMQRA